LVIYSSNYIRNLLKYKIELDELVDELKKYSKYNKYCIDEATYYFISKVIKDDLFFGKNEETLKEILYLSIFWSGLNEYKNSKNKQVKPTRKKTANKVTVNSKKINLYTSLQSSLIKSIYRNFKTLERDEKVELYLLIFFEFNCVKRKKREG